MNKEDLMCIVKLRLLVGYLGEQNQYGWWTSSFFSANSNTFLKPIFNKNLLLSQYNGVKAAATFVHDNHIGVGQGVYHLFRLPEVTEQDLHNLLVEHNGNNTFTNLTLSKTIAYDALNSLGNQEAKSKSGPIRIGDVADISKYNIWELIASYYKYALETEIRVFPYFTKG